MMENVVIIGRKGIPESTMPFAFNSEMTAFSVYADLKDAYAEDDLFIELTSRHTDKTKWNRNKPTEHGFYLAAYKYNEETAPTNLRGNTIVSIILFNEMYDDWCIKDAEVLGWMPLPRWEDGDGDD